MRQPLLPERRHAKAIIGMVHLLPLPGSPRWGGSMVDVVRAAAADARALEQGGVDAIMIENYGDAPFFPERVPAETVASMSVVVARIADEVSLPLGVNVLRNDAASALAICAATTASLIRVNVHTGAMLTDQGWINGQAHGTLRLRAQLGLAVAILADVLVKHATAPVGLSIESAARDTWQRGFADALIVSGTGTALPTSPEDVERTSRALPEAPVLIGSGVTERNAAALLRHADGAIIGSAFKHDGHTEAPVSVDRVRSIMNVVSSIDA